MTQCARLAVLVAFSALVSSSIAAQSGDKVSSADTSELPDCSPQLGGRGDPTAYSTEPFNCHCTAEARRLRGGYAFGSGPYDGISNICMAALHAGATGKEGGDIRVIPGPIQESFVGTLANGVFSSDWDSPSQFGSFDVEPFTGQ